MTDERERELAAAEDASLPRRSGAGGLLLSLVLIGISGALAFAVVRRMLGSKPSDPTTERIASLIDEANRLLKELDDKKPS